MIKKWLKKHLPTQQSIKKSRTFKVLKPYMKSSSFWAFNCQSIARGVAAGLAGAVIPGFQLLYAALLVILFRGNLPVALLATLITNPLTVLPITLFICFIGSLIIGNGRSDCVIHDFSSFSAFWSHFSVWILQFGKAFLVGVPILSVSLALIGYFGTIAIWKACAFLFSIKKK